MNNNFVELSNNEMMDIDGGMPFVLGVLAAGGIVVGTAFVTAGTVYLVGKGVQWVGDKIFG
ncbi:class IIb bacteriocin, lactobin A/cerein 7B family [uncultured Ruminococcus sp.]|uniref:class IIb bacteriocin, lactobin A/cerein 7B family n=1 Tax=uncultured Ruminococcus sp. TaxID=165186 RepID=UPI0025FB2629|nr:class IIb bacteriocin, lactobin A/cerein 7B family [uncultured Ruminococcus sp.]